MMYRIATIFACLFAPAAMGQGLKTPYVPPYFSPTMPFVPMAAPVSPMGVPFTGVNGFAGSVQFGNVRLGMVSTFPAPYSYPLTALNPYAFGYNPIIVSNMLPAPAPLPPAPVPLPNLAPNTPLNRDLAEAEFTAKLEIVFPSPAEVTCDGKRVEDSQTSEVSFTSPPMKVGASHSFHVHAVWSVEGRKYQLDRTIAVKAGERSHLMIVAGDPVK